MEGMCTWSIDHQDDSMVGKWESSGAREYEKSCYGQFNWLHPWTLAKLKNLKKEKYVSL